MKVSLFFVVCFAFSLLSFNSWAADAEHGKELHEPNCISCHGNDLYTRANRLDSLVKLTARVEVCNQQIPDLEWWPEDVEDVVEYLNQQFYRFK